MYLRCFMIVAAAVVLPGCRPSAREAAPARVEPGGAQDTITEPKVPELVFTDPRRGFPPQPREITNVRDVPWEPIRGGLSDELARRLGRAVAVNPTVRGRLGERWVHVSTQQLDPGKAERPAPRDSLDVQSMFYSYTNNVAIEVFSRGERVDSVRAVPGYQPPETPDEIQTAISLARQDQRIRERVGGLAADAILTPPLEGKEVEGHRLMYVTFRGEKEFYPRFWAVVDMTLGRVFASGEAVPYERRP